MNETMRAGLDSRREQNARAGEEGAAPRSDVPRGRPATDLLVRVFRLLILYALLRPLVLLPLSWQLRVGRALGRFGRRFAHKPRWTVQRNFEICFPELGANEIQALVTRQFEALGMSVVETAFGWWASERRLRERIDVEGLEHYEAASAGGRSVILVAAHYTTMELGAIALGTRIPGVYAVYRPYDRNPLADALAKEGRGRYAGGMIARDDVHAMLRVLRQKRSLWIAGDQLVRADKRSALVPFFGVPCLVHGAVLDLARLTGASILPVTSIRLPDERYRVTVVPVPQPFPSADRVSDLTRIMAVIEAQVRLDPAQYTWVWQRFAKRPPEYPDLYRR